MPLTLSTIKTLASAGQPGLWAHGEGLCLVVARGRASWAFRYSLGSKRRLMTLEPYEPITAPKLKALEVIATGYRQQVKAGRDPLAERVSIEQPIPASETFEDFARNYIEDRKEGWSVAYVGEWRRTLKKYAYQIIGAKRPQEITTDDVLLVLKQPYKGATFWEAKTETASRLRGRIEKVIGAAKAKGLSDADTRHLWEGHHNPAAWSDNLQHWLTGRKSGKHFEAIDWQDAPAIAKALAVKTDLASCCLLLNLLCGVRASGARKSRWSDFDLEGGFWNIPPERMKAKKAHNIPLSSQAVELLRRLPRFAGNPLVFPGRGNSFLAPDVLTKRLRDITGDRATVHASSRSTFSDWAEDTTLHPTNLVKVALAHAVSDKTYRAYRRKTAIERRKQLMQQWADYLLTNEKDYQANWKRFLALT